MWAPSRDAGRRAGVAVVAAALLAGCAPGDPAKQAEAIGSIAAESALLADEIADGSTTATFAREHAHALGRSLDKVQGAIDDPELARLARDVADALERLADAGKGEAASLHDRLEQLAAEAEETTG